MIQYLRRKKGKKMKNMTSFDAFLSIKKIKGIDFILNCLQVHKGTIKRWEKQQSIPKNYDTDLKKK
ncbi:hypothetical protein HGD80_01450 [Paulownia witches'-broom phytoplasma]|uniref:XRE family transcriptional regulator n=1 Tax=Paulownia witches'-broom phytoplasma TaxID=39647 RepID=A0ABX8TPI6_9MOLU|nr:hypothetical protein [Paulownia witches'-broom phytoplasma]QYC31240.1 hypothetical protein HGD80_01450 [Paulownia witches'-broom phytoplasma]